MVFYSYIFNRIIQERMGLVCIIFILTLVTVEAVQEQKALLHNTYQEGYGVYDLDSGLMVSYDLPDVGGYAPVGKKEKVNSRLPAVVFQADNNTIRHHEQEFYLTVDQALEPMETYVTKNGIKLRLVGDWEYLKGNRYTYKFKAFRSNTYPFNTKDFLHNFLIKQDENTDTFPI